MNTYFIRHTSALDIDKELINRLWEENLIAIHYPEHDINSLEPDIESLDPNDYGSRSGKSSMNTLSRLAREGGYVCAVYKNKLDVRIGIVKPDSSIDLLYGKWGRLRDDNTSRKAVMKSIKLTQSKVLSPSEAILFRYVQPRQGTICQWRAIGQKVGARYDISLKSKDHTYLSADQLEVLCAEFLRSGNAEQEGLPQIVSMLTPIGRTMKDIDLIGLDKNGYKVIAQVTHHSETSGRWKIESLKVYGSENATLIMFCNCNAIKQVDDVLLYPIKRVFDLYVNRSKAGHFWFDSIA